MYCSISAFNTADTLSACSIYYVRTASTAYTRSFFLLVFPALAVFCPPVLLIFPVLAVFQSSVLTAVFTQFLGSASTTFFSPFLSLLPLLVSSFLAFVVFSFHSFPFFAFFSFISFPFSSLLFFVSFFQIDLSLTCVCVVIGTTRNIHMVVFPGWQAVESVFQARVVKRMHQYGPGTS